MEAQCPACGRDPPKLDWVVIRDADGNEHPVEPALAGAEGRYEDWIYLRMLEREWLRPVDADLYDSIPVDHRPSARAIVVLVFWSYFETRIERLFRETAKAVPEKVMDHLLDRHSFVGARMDRLYRVVFSTTYRADLNELGYGNVAALLKCCSARGLRADRHDKLLKLRDTGGHNCTPNNTPTSGFSGHGPLCYVRTD